MKSRDELHKYWRSPNDGVNHPEDYAIPQERSIFLISIMKRYAERNWRILELGCGIGRNLNHLLKAGFSNLDAIELSENALEYMIINFPLLYGIPIYHGAIENHIRDIPRNTYDIVFTMAVLEHIHPDSEWIFSEIIRITKQFILTIEDEHTNSNRHFPRNYKRIFTKLGARQREKIRKCYGLPKGFTARVFSI